MGISIKWIGQNGFILSFGETKICVDPYLSDSVNQAEGLERLVPIPLLPQNLQVDMILCTHDHLDHCDPETLRYTDRNHILYAGPDSCMQKFVSIGIPLSQTRRLNRQDRIDCKDLSIYGVYSKHTDDSIGLVFEYEDQVIYLTGDTEYDKQLLDIGDFQPDLIIGCINGKWGNMTAKEAALLGKELKVKGFIPCHYGMFQENTTEPKQLEAELKDTGIAYLEPLLNEELTIKTGRKNNGKN